MKKIKIIIALFISISSLYSQQGFVATGGDINNNTGSISYSVGLVNYINVKNNTHSISQGIQHPYIGTVVTALKHIPGLKATIYPNPAFDYTTLDIDYKDLKGLTYTLIDLAGRQVNKKTLDSNKSIIELSTMGSGLYVLNLSHQNQIVQSFKIIKL